MALALGEAVRAQDIRIRTGMTPEGELIAVAGATETEVDAPEPRSAPSPLFDAGETPNPAGSAGALPEGAAAAGDGTLLLRELAYVSDLHRMLVASGDAIFGMSRRPMPRLALSGSMGSALQAMTNRRVLRKATHRPNLFTQLRDLSERQTSQLLKAIEPLERSLRDLLATLRGLEQDGRALTALRADGGAPALSARVTGPDAAPGTHTVRVERLARAHAVESGVTATDGTPLSALVTEEGEPLLAGSGFTFSLNGVEVAVSLDDSLPEIARIINRGEDRNLNGVLDTGDAWTPTEDADGDGELDGGTAAHGIVAEVVADRLRLRMASPGGASIEIADPDGLLEALGMVEQTALGRFRFPNELTAPSGARFTVGDTQYDRPGNEVTDAIPGVELTLLQEGTETVEVAVAGDGEAVVQELRPLLERYNGAVRAFNRTLSSTLPGLLRHEAHVSRTYLDLRHAMEDPVSGQPVTLRTTAQAGIVNTGAARVTFHEVQLARARAQIRGSGARGPLERIKSPPSVVNALDEIGITAESDNTLALEPDRIRTAVEEQVEALGDLFRREGGGVLPRLVREVEQAADPVGGLMAFLRRRLQALGASTFPQDAVRRLQQAQASVLRARLVQSSLGSLIA
jgi:flagellar capping protein FliD